MDLRQLDRALALFSQLEPGSLPLHHVQVFLVVAIRTTATYRDLEEELNLSNASISRSVNALASNVRHRQTSHGLLEVFIDPEEGRRYRVRLSAKGKALTRALASI